MTLAAIISRFPLFFQADLVILCYQANGIENAVQILNEMADSTIIERNEIAGGPEGTAALFQITHRRRDGKVERIDSWFINVLLYK